MTKYYKITDHRTNDIIYGGYYKSFRHCIETAINKNINLSHCDLRDQDLSHANLDGGSFIGTLLTRSNLFGVNMSECDLTLADCSNTNMDGACLALSTCYGTNFADTHFNQTDVTDSFIKKCDFSTFSSLMVKWDRCATFTDNIFTTQQCEPYAISKPPVTIHGLPLFIAILDDVTMINDTAIPHQNFQRYDKAYYTALFGQDVARYLYASHHYLNNNCSLTA